MKIYINNIGVIRESEVQIDGITVITGYNDSGKTTFGKTVFSLVNAVHNLLPRARTDKTLYILHGVNEGLYQFLPLNVFSFEENMNMGNSLSVRLIDLVRRNSEYELEPEGCNIIDSIEQAKGFYSDVLRAADDMILGMYKENERGNYGKGIINKRNHDGFQEELNILNEYVKMLDDDPEALNYADRRIISSLQTEFYNQIIPLRYRSKTGEIRLFEGDDTIFDIKVKNNRLVTEENSFHPIALFSGFKACMIDEAQDLDQILDRRTERVRLSNNTRNISRISAFYQQMNVKSHKSELARMLLPSDSTYGAIASEMNAKEILDKIHEVFEDTIIFDRGSLICANSKVDVRNLAAGTKMFAMIHQLVSYGCLDEKTILILDEPDSHLHPEWQMILAEVLFLLNEKVGVKIILTTHSVDFLYAMDVYQKEYNTVWNVYDSQKLEDDYSVRYVNATDDLKAVYNKLGEPFQRMRKREMINESR